MSNIKNLLDNEVIMLEKSINDKEMQRWTAEPAAIPAIDREIRQLKRRLQNIQESVKIQEIDTEAETIALDEVTKAKIAEGKLYEEAAEAHIDFNNHDNPMLVSVHRLGESIELVDILTDAANLNKEYANRFPDIGYFTEPLNNAIAAREERIKKARAKVDDAETKQREIEQNLQEAKAFGEVENIIALTDQLEDAKKVVQCFKELLSEEEKRVALSAGDSLATWEKVCEVYGYEWRNRLQAILMAAQIYHENLKQLNELNNYLWQVRKNIQNIGERNGDPDNRIKAQRITCNLPDVSKVMRYDEEAQLTAAVFFRRGEML